MSTNEMIIEFRRNIAALNSVFSSLHLLLKYEDHEEKQNDLRIYAHKVLDQIESMTSQLGKMIEKNDLNQGISIFAVSAMSLV